MQISQEVRDFAKANPSPFTGEGDSPAASGERGAEDKVPTPEEAEAGMAAMSERYREGGDLYVPTGTLTAPLDHSKIDQTIG